MANEKIKIDIDVDLQDLIPRFIENRKNEIQLLHKLVSENDIPAVAQLAHKIKGTAAGYGFSHLSNLASEMELAARNNDPYPLVSIVTEMNDHFDNIEINFINS